MKSCVILLIVCSTFVIQGFGYEFPADWKCAFGDEKCIQERVNDILKNHATGSADINFNSLDPLEVPFFSREQSTDSPVNINLKFIENRIEGLANAKIIRVKGFGKDIKGPHEIHIKTPVLYQLGKYEVNGRLLILPISGSGNNNLTYINPVIKFKAEGKAMEKDGKTYLNIGKEKVQIVPEDMVVELTNLFNGDKALGDNMNKFLNENWRDIFKELEENIVDVLSQIFKIYVEKVFAAQPYEDFFLKEK